MARYRTKKNRKPKRSKPRCPECSEHGPCDWCASDKEHSQRKREEVQREMDGDYWLLKNGGKRRMTIAERMQRDDPEFFNFLQEMREDGWFDPIQEGEIQL